MDFIPPRPLTLRARQTFDRHAERIHAEGRMSVIDQDMLCLYAETLDLYEQFKTDVETHGTLVPARAAQESVRNPSLMGLAQARTDLIRLAKAVPLVDPKPDKDGAAVDSWIDDMLAMDHE
jgi:phage terminase small subunit